MRLLLSALFILWAACVAAQTSDDDRDFITGLIEDAVSNDDMTVRLINFQGALSSEATADAITLADPDGIWLRLDDLTLSWNRSALLSGRLEIETLAAERIELIRLPDTPASDGPTAEATPFTLPELPVSVQIDGISANEIILTEALLGEPVTAQFEGALKLIDGVGTADILLQRTDTKTGRFDVEAAYTSDTRQLSLSLLAEEGENGIAARLLNLPDRPAVRLDVQGDAPLDDFIGDIALATNGIDRITGTVALSRPAGTVDQAFAVDLKGDLRPLLADQYDPFFGAVTVLRAEGTKFGIGGLRLSRLTVAAEQVVLRGSAAFDAQGWPQAIDLRGQLSSTDNSRVLLPLPGTPTEVSGISLSVQYDSDAGDEWRGAFDITSLGRTGLSIDSLALSGGGIIQPGAGGAQGRFTADLDFAARGLALDDPSLNTAIGEDITGSARVGRNEGEPFVVNALSINGAGVSAVGRATINGPDARFLTEARLAIEATDFARFAEISGLENLAGAGSITLFGTVQPFDGILDFDLTANTRDLAVGIAQIDPLLTGRGTVSLGVERDTTGTRLRQVQVTSTGVQATGRAEITTDTASATLTADLTELALIAPNLSGPARLELDAARDPQGVIALDTTLTAPLAQVAFQGVGTPRDNGYLLRGEGRGSVDDLLAYRGLIGQRLGGAVSATVDGTFDTATRALDADVVAQTRDLALGAGPLDRILAGAGQIAANVTLSERGRLRLDALDADFPNFTVDGAVTSTGNDTLANLSLRLRDVALLVSDFSGPLVADLTARQDAAGWQVSGDATGPANTSARASGRVSNSGDLDLSVTGSAPLALANLYIAPRQVNGLATFDLQVQGPPALTSVRGPVRIENARLSAPLLRQAVENINGTVLMAGGTARVDLRGSSAAGGDLTLTGPVDLTPPFQAGLTVRLADIVLRDPTLYRTTAQGQITVTGPLAGGATIAGTIQLGQVDVQVPSTGVSPLGSLPAVTHLGVPTDVRRTLERADIGVAPAPRTEQRQGADFPLDLLITAPARIFVRGRGLDAELGGQLRLTGTTNNIVPLGQFELVRGRLGILGQRFDLDEGFAQMQGDFTPYLRLVASTETRSGVLVRIVLDGPADALDVRFESTPVLPQDEVLAQLLFGRDLSSITPLQAVQLASAVATLAGTGGSGGGVLNSVREGLDLDDLDLVTDDSGGVAVRAGKYITENVYTDITVGADGTSEVNLNIDLTDSFTARGSYASDGETSLGVFFERDY